MTIDFLLIKVHTSISSESTKSMFSFETTLPHQRLGDHPINLDIHFGPSIWKSFWVQQFHNSKFAPSFKLHPKTHDWEQNAMWYCNILGRPPPPLLPYYVIYGRPLIKADVEIRLYHQSTHDDDCYFLDCNSKAQIWCLFDHGEYIQPQRALIKHWIQNG